jgi:hypothetical protein
MELHVDDDGFVRAGAPLVYRRLTDIAAWERWWPGVRVRPADPPPSAPAPASSGPLRGGPGHDVGDEAWRLRLTSGLVRIDVTAVPHAWRLDTGFALALSGDLVGRAEFWLERGWGGTVVHHVLAATTPRRRPRRVHHAYRRVVRRGLWGLKDVVHAEVLDGEPST